jgi:RNA polymerase sigma-70 factor (ECF subfamily)
MTREEQRLVRRFQDGEPGGFEALYDLYGPRLYRFCYRLCGRVDDAEDLTQEVFLAAYQGRERFAGRASVTTWLYRIALYRWRRLFAGRDAEVVSLDRAEEPMIPDLAPMELERWALERALAALPETLRESFLLVKAEGLKYREAAVVLGIPQGTVQSRVHDAAVRLRELLAEPVDEPPEPHASCPVLEERQP